MERQTTGRQTERERERERAVKNIIVAFLNMVNAPIKK
jgi:hypothetical protein